MMVEGRSGAVDPEALAYQDIPDSRKAWGSTSELIASSIPAGSVLSRFCHVNVAVRRHRAGRSSPCSRATGSNQAVARPRDT